jgi:hypothetical protein
LLPVVGIDDDFNLYAYVGNDPLSKADPTGTESARIAVYSACMLSGQSDCGSEPHIESADAFSAVMPGIGSLTEYEQGNYKLAGSGDAIRKERGCPSHSCAELKG